MKADRKTRLLLVERLAYALLVALVLVAAMMYLHHRDRPVYVPADVCERCIEDVAAEGDDKSMQGDSAVVIPASSTPAPKAKSATKKSTKTKSKPKNAPHQDNTDNSPLNRPVSNEF